MHNLTSQYWTSEKKPTKPKIAESEIYPYRVFAASDGLAVNLRIADMDLDYYCTGPVQGFKILLHTFGEIPQISNYYYRIPLDHEVIISVKPILILTSESVEHYPPEK